MNARLAKEFRALRLPWVGGMLAAVAATVAGRATGDPRVYLFGLNASGGCAALLAAMAFGAEFRHRTLSLLLSQPCPRRELWHEKLLVLGALAGTLGLVEAVGWKVAGPYGALPEAVGVQFLFLAMVCSAPLWTLVARSIIGGAVFSLAGVFVLMLLAFWIPLALLHAEQEWLYGVLIPIMALAYSALCLHAAGRRFERFELKDALAGESTILSGAPAARARGWGWLRIRPGGALGNLVRKELRLQRPTLVVAGAFCVCWLAAAALKPSNPQGVYALLLPGLACGYIVLAVALAGSISQGEESALGLGAWHLTLPISARRQWLVKLAVAAAAALVLGVVLPGVLALATLPEARDALGNVGRSNVVLVNPDLSDVVLTAVPVGAGLWLFFVLSFWAATLLRDTLRAIFMAGLSFAALGLWAALSVWLYVKAAGLGGFETGLLREIFAGWHLPTSYAVKVWIHLGGGVPPPWYRPLYDFDKAVPWALALGVLLVSLVALGQSRHQFRRGQVPRGAIIKCAAVLLAIAALAACCCADFRVSVRPEWSLPHYTQKQMLDMERKIKQYRTTRSLPHYTEKELLESPGGIRITQSEREKV